MCSGEGRNTPDDRALADGLGQRFATEGDTPLNVDTVLSKPPKLRELREALARGMQAEK